VSEFTLSSAAEHAPSFSARAGKLALRFVVPVSLLVLLIAVLLTFSITRIARTRLTAALSERGESLAQDLAYNSELGVLIGQQTLLSDLVQGILRQEDVLYVEVVESKNHPLIQAEKNGYNGILQERKSSRVATPGQNAATAEYFLPGRNFSVLEVYAPVFTVKKERSREEIGLAPLHQENTPADRNELRRIGAVRIGISTARIATTIDSFIKTIALLTLVTILLIILVVGWTIYRVVIFPVRKLALSMQQVASGDLSIQVATPGDDEIAQLAKSFNVMAASLRAARDELEQRVRERTKDLQQEVTVRKQAEERITKLNIDLQHRATELQEAVGQLESFSYSISHDLRAPLRAIDGYSRMIMEEYRDRVDEEGNRLLAVIRNNAITMGQLIDDLLTFSRLGRQEIKQSLIDMNSLLKSIYEELKSGSPERKIDFETQKLPDAIGDVAMIRQVLTNLLSNAIKFTAKRETAMITVGYKNLPAETVYYVADNGIGFDMQYAGKLFGVFRRLVNATDFEGTGVGLAIVQGIIQKHGGRVWAEGKLDHGSTFYFTLPKRGIRR
jgi:signal transduction histidine kinase